MTTTIHAQEALTLIQNGQAVLIDVREPDEFKAEHIAYALSIPLSVLENDFQKLAIPADKTILFQCLKGSRGQMACEKVRGLGVCPNPIINIKGGIEAWKELGQPIIRSSTAAPKLSLFRQVQIIVGLLVAMCVLIGFMGLTFAFILAGVLGVALFMAGLTGWCGLAMLLAKMPWNKG